MALLYSYLFPTIFLVAFWVLYRFEQVPLVRHVGELLTVTALGGACFGLPTTMVSERERGVWRRYRLTPVATVDAGRGNGRGAVSAPRHRGASSARARHGPGHADAAASDRSLRGVHAGGVRLHRARARDCDDGRHRAGGAGARAVHLPADAHHRRRRRAAREPARLGADVCRGSSRAATRSRHCRPASPAAGWAPRASARWRSSSSAWPAASPARRCFGGIPHSGSRPRRARAGWRSRWPRGSPSASRPRRRGERWLAPWPGRCLAPLVRNWCLHRRQ